MQKKELITTGLIALVLIVLIVLTWSTVLSIFLTLILLLTVPIRLIQTFIIDRENTDFLENDNG